jgi:hypothetical protein
MHLNVKRELQADRIGRDEATIRPLANGYRSHPAWRVGMSAWVTATRTAWNSGSPTCFWAISVPTPPASSPSARQNPESPQTCNPQPNSVTDVLSQICYLRIDCASGFQSPIHHPNPPKKLIIPPLSQSPPPHNRAICASQPSVSPLTPRLCVPRPSLNGS